MTYPQRSEIRFQGHHSRNWDRSSRLQWTPGDVRKNFFPRSWITLVMWAYEKQLKWVSRTPIYLVTHYFCVSMTMTVWGCCKRVKIISSVECSCVPTGPWILPHMEKSQAEAKPVISDRQEYYEVAESLRPTSDSIWLSMAARHWVRSSSFVTFVNWYWHHNFIESVYKQNTVFTIKTHYEVNYLQPWVKRDWSWGQHCETPPCETFGVQFSWMHD